jgi:hypothetical protein
MKRLTLFTLITTLFITGLSMNLFAQEQDGLDAFEQMGEDYAQQSLLEAGLGVSQIGNQTYVGMRLQPELAIGKFGLGLDIPLFFNIQDGTFRTDEFTGGVGVLRLIRYARWGVKKRDPLYLRVGTLDNAYLGYGMLINHYTNATSFEKRKVGLSYDLLIKEQYGMEGIYSDFNFQSLNLVGIRPYVRPFGATDIPVLKTLDVGISFVTDHDNTSMKINDSTTIQNNTYISDGIFAYGADMGVHFVNNRFFRLTGFTQYGKLQKANSNSLPERFNEMASETESSKDSSLLMNYDGGSGISAGLEANMMVGGNLVRVDARLERLWYNDYFIPHFFDASYEINKDARLIALGTAEEKKGVYGSLRGTVLDKISLEGSLLIPDNVSHTAPGMVQLQLDASQLIPKIAITGTYYKGELDGFSLDEVFTLDERSLTNLRVAYKIKPWLLLGVDYKWTYAQTEEGGFEATNHIMPYFGLSLPFNLGGSSTPGSDFDEDPEDIY